MRLQLRLRKLIYHIKLMSKGALQRVAFAVSNPNPSHYTASDIFRCLSWQTIIYD